MSDKVIPIPQKRNANRHTVRGMAALETSIATDGWIGAITVAADGETFDGSARVEKTAENGMLDEALVIDIDGRRPVVLRRVDIAHATDPRAVRLGIAANRVASLNLDFDPSILAGIAERGIDLSGLFTADEWAEVSMPALPDAGAGGDEFDAEPEDGPTRTALGELWSIGKVHRLLVGDCTDAANVARLMGGERAGIGIFDPPYGMRLDTDWTDAKGTAGFVAAKSTTAGNKYEEVIGDHQDFDASPIVKEFSYLKEQFWFGADYYSATLGDTMHSGAWLVWDKREGESLDKAIGSCFELVWSKQKHKRDILRHKWCFIFGTEHEPQRGRQHPNQKPERLLTDIMERYSPAGALVVEMFLGSGTTLIAAHRTGRRCYGMEIAPRYADVILRRAEAEGLACERVDE